MVDFWKEQATPEYDESFLLTPPSEEDQDDGEILDGEQDPMYEDAIRVVLEMGKSLHFDPAEALAPGLRPRSAYSRHDAARRHHRSAGRAASREKYSSARIG